MAKIILAEIDFKIRLENKNLSFSQLRERSYKMAFEIINYRDSNDNTKYGKSPLEIFLRERLKKLFRDEDVSVFVTDYSEREGSFIISFSFFVFATFMSYGSLRESLDYLKQDFDFFFGGIFPKDTSIDIDYSVSNKKVGKNIQQNLLMNAVAPIHKQLNVLKAIIGFIGLLALGFSFYSVYAVGNLPGTLTEDAIQTKVRTEIEKINAQKTNEEVLRILQELKWDSLKLGR